MANEPKDEKDEKAAAKAKRLSRRMKETIALPAVFSDTFFLSYWKGHVRITFGEETDEDDVDCWRSAVILQTRVIQSLVKRLTEVLDELGELEKAEK